MQQAKGKGYMVKNHGTAGLGKNQAGGLRLCWVDEKEEIPKGRVLQKKREEKQPGVLQSLRRAGPGSRGGLRAGTAGAEGAAHCLGWGQGQSRGHSTIRGQGWQENRGS